MKTIEQACAAYDVTLVVTGMPDWPPDGTEFGNHAALSFERRTVYAEPDSPSEEVFHEVMHIVLAVPGRELCETPEDLVLLQAERAIAWHVRECRRVWDDVIRYQAVSAAPLVRSGIGLGRSGYGNWSAWRHGFQLARELGVIDDARRPTWRLPKWTPTLKKTCHALIDGAHW